MSHPPPADPTPDARLDVSLDICPMTFVKAKLELEDLPRGAVLEILVREGEPLRNVSRSCQEEGHAVDDRGEAAPGVRRLLVAKGGGVA